MNFVKKYSIPEDLLSETIAGLSVFGAAATQDTVEKLRHLDPIPSEDRKRSSFDEVKFLSEYEQ